MAIPSFAPRIALPLLALALGCQAAAPRGAGSVPRHGGRDVAQAPGAPTASDAATPPEKGTQVEFFLLKKDERWSVRSSKGEVLCTLPCKGRIEDDSEFYLQREPDDNHSKRVVPLPAKFDVAQGGAVRAVPHAGRGNSIAAAATGVLSLVVGVVPGILFLNAGDTRQCQIGPGSSYNISTLDPPPNPPTVSGPCSQARLPEGVDRSQGRDVGRSAEANRNLGLVFLGVGLVGAGLSIAWWSWSESPRLDVMPLAGRSAAPALRLGPGFAQGTF